MRLISRIVLAAFMVGASARVDAQQTIGGENLRIFQTSTLSGNVGHEDYISQLAKWRIGSDGSADFRYLFTDELYARKFVADLEQALAGSQVISKSVAALASNFTAPAAGAASTITVRDLPSAENMAVFESGDTIRLRTFSRAFGSLTVADAYGVVTSHADQPGGVQNWTFTRNSGANAGSMAAGTTIEADAIVLDYGISGNGYHEINAIDGLYGINSPYSQVVTWATSPIAGNLIVRSRLGNLRGITGVTGEYGAIFGTYAASNGQYIRASNQALELHGVNLQMWDGATNVIKLDRTAPSLAIGTPIPSGYLSGGNGFWVGKDSSVYKLRIGNPGGHRLTWDGATLNVAGAITLASPTSPSSAGLYIGSDKLGYHNGTAWMTYMDSAGNFELGGAGGALSWNASAGTLSINGSGVTNINGGNIQTGSITAAQIDGGTITADKLNVSSLSAITANLGTVTAGSISGVTATFAGTVNLNSSGITISAGGVGVNQYKWDDGTSLQSSGGSITINASSGGFVSITGQGLLGPNKDFGTSGSRWRTLYLNTQINNSNWAGGGNQYVCVNNSGVTFVAASC